MKNSKEEPLKRMEEFIKYHKENGKFPEPEYAADIILIAILKVCLEKEEI